MKTKTTSIIAILALCYWVQVNAQTGKIYVSDAGNFNFPPWQILRFDENGENGEVFISDHLAWPQDIFFLESSNTVLISNLNTNRISKFNAATGAYTGEFATNISGPTRMKLGPDSLLYVLQAYGNGKVRRYNLNGALIGDFTAVGVGTSIGLDWDAEGNLYVSSYEDKIVRKFSPTGADLGLFINSNLAGPTNIWFADNGDLLVVDFIGGSVKRFSSAGAYLGVFIAGLPEGEGVEFLPGGNILLGCGGYSSVRMYNESGDFLSDLVPSGTLDLLKPNAVVWRNMGVSSTTSVETGVAFLVPSIGSVFQMASVSEDWPGDLLTEIYNSSGGLAARIDFSESCCWDAQNQPNGVYLALFRMSDGSRIATQKIIVQK